jgi:hypothetical protein
MKNFFELLATNLSIDIDIVLVPKQDSPVEVVINGNCIYNAVMKHPTELHYSVLLLDPINISIFHQGVYLESLRFDGWEARPEHAQEVLGIWRFQTTTPFYQWHHHATAQGWLLTPT